EETVNMNGKEDCISLLEIILRLSKINLINEKRLTRTPLLKSSVSVQHGHTTTLPCWLNPSQNAEGMEVRWYYDDRFNIPIILYQAQMLYPSQDTLYKGRVSFGLKDGLKTGDVSLKLVNAMIGDAGDYTCYINNNQSYDKGTITLSVIGECPENGKDDFKNKICESVGWYPQPHLRWADKTQNLKPKNLLYSKISSGLMSVHSWVQVPSTSDVSCTVGLPDGEEKVARVQLGDPPQHATQETNLLSFLMGQMLPVSQLSKDHRASLLENTTGRFPWARENVGFKRSWWVGVTTATAFPLQSDVPPTTSNGFWFLSSSPDRADSLQFNTQPNVLLPVRSMPQRVGVYLNYDSGELSFYNVEDRSVIGSLTANFTGEVFPLFNPGKHDKVPMEIIQKPMEDESNKSNDIENSVQSTALETQMHTHKLLCDT
uniref:Ig-like domain-containing protein n=1 Tax=Anabas testudineus TaxID=64144 RepID=A0A3Q1J922_ANATE